MQELETANKKVAEFETAIKPILDYTASVDISNDEALAEAGEWLTKIQKRKRELEDERVSITKPINDGLNLIRAKFNGPINELEKAAQSLKNGIKGYHQLLEQRRLEQQRKLEEEARKEREKLEKKRAEEERKAREKEEALRQQAEEADAAERAKIEAKIAANREKSEAKQEALQQQAATVVAPVVQTNAPKVAGVSLRGVWKGEVIDLDALIKAAASGDTLAKACLMANDKVVNQQAKTLKDNFTVPGIKVWEDKTVAA